jgi:hypothetical protein
LPPGSSSLHSPLHRRRQVSLLNDADDSRRLGSALSETISAARLPGGVHCHRLRQIGHIDSIAAAAPTYYPRIWWPQGKLPAGSFHAKETRTPSTSESRAESRRAAAQYECFPSTAKQRPRGFQSPGRLVHALGAGLRGSWSGSGPPTGG